MKERIVRSPPLPILLLLALPAMISLPALAQEDPFAGALFPPDLVLRHTTELGLEAAHTTSATPVPDLAPTLVRACRPMFDRNPSRHSSAATTPRLRADNQSAAQDSPRI